MTEKTRKQKILVNAIVPISMVLDAKKHHQGKNAHYIVPCQVACLEFHSFDHPTFGQWEADKSPVLSLFHLHKFECTGTQNFIRNNFINRVIIYHETKRYSNNQNIKLFTMSISIFPGHSSQE